MGAVSSLTHSSNPFQIYTNTAHNHKYQYRLSEYIRCVWGGGEGRMLATSDTTSRQTLQMQTVREGCKEFNMYRKGKGIKFLIFQICVITNLSVPSCFCLWSYGIFKLFKIPGIDSKESFPPAYVDWRAGTTNLFLLSSQPPQIVIKFQH